ncbi:MAG: hypothetical protein MSH58_09535 [Clostridiales bacterium]|nr:hypothetical protein [Clostridiales bacterium]
MKEQKKENQFSSMTREQIILEAKKQILHSAVLALAALIVIGVACYAWFANNRVVTANLSSVSLNADCFELASEGGAGVFDGKLPAEYNVPGETWLNSSNTKGTYTAGKQAVTWCMNSGSNLNNQAAVGDLPAGNGIAPGSSGKLTFYVIPKINGELTLTFSIDVIPLKQVGNTMQELGETADETAARQLLQGHLLFSETYNDKTQSVLFNNRSFTLNFGTVTKDGAPIPVTLDWRWPYLLADAKADETVAQWIGNAEYAQYFYYNPADTGENTVNISGATDKNLNDWFNDADQKIGDKIDAIILQLTAVME